MAKNIIVPVDCKIVTKGNTSDIYLVSDSRAVKLAWGCPPERFILEHKIQKEIYRAGYPVPEVFEKHPFYLNKDYNLPMGFSMERIHGRDLEDIGDDKKSLMMEEARTIVRSIEKNLDTGIVWHYSLEERNVMLDEKNDRIVLVDFGHWNYLEFCSAPKFPF